MTGTEPVATGGNLMSKLLGTTSVTAMVHHAHVWAMRDSQPAYVRGLSLAEKILAEYDGWIYDPWYGVYSHTDTLLAVSDDLSVLEDELRKAGYVICIGGLA